MSTNPLDLVSRLAALSPFRADAVARETGVALRRDSSATNPYFAIYRSADLPKGAWSRVELRERLNPAPGKGGMLVLDVARDPCVGTDEATRRFGEAEVSIPTPHEPADAPLYFVYKQPWGELRLGYSRTEPQCLVTVVLDATGS